MGSDSVIYVIIYLFIFPIVAQTVCEQEPIEKNITSFDLHVNIGVE